MKLSKRLCLAASFVPEGSIVADIGADRGELSYYLLKEGIAEKAILSDISPHSLDRAQRFFAGKKEASKADFRVGDGFSVLRPGEADVAVLAGMGGLTITDILWHDEDTVRSMSSLVIQAMGNSDKVRSCLRSLGFTLADEAMVEEEGQFYTIMRAVPGVADWDEIELFAGPVLLAKKDETLGRWLDRERIKSEALLKRLRERNEGGKRQLALTKILSMIDAAEKRLIIAEKGED